MAMFTMNFKDAVEALGGEIVTDDRGTKLINAHLVGLGSYSVKNPANRERLNGMICDRYMNREIGVETPSDFRRLIRSRMNEIMPLFDRVYEADAIKFDPLRTVDVRTLTTASNESATLMNTNSEGNASSSETGEATTRGTTSSETEAGARSRAVTSDTPQTMLKGMEDYASAASDHTGTNTSTGTAVDEKNATSGTDQETISREETASSADTKGSQTGESRTVGYQGSPALLIREYRESLVNIDEMVLDQLESCFMQIFSTDETEVRFGYFLPATYPRF